MSGDKIILLSLPNRNMDYPGLSLPMLASHLNAEGFNVEIRDVNLEIRDKFITAKTLEEMTDYIVPEILLQNLNEPLIRERILNLISFLHGLNDIVGFSEIEKTKKMMQERKYEELLTNENGFTNVMRVFRISRALHNLIDILPLYNEVLEKSDIEDPVTCVYKGLIEHIQKSNPLFVGLSVLDIQRRASFRFAKMLRIYSNCTIVAGGSDPTRFPMEYLKNYSYIDYVFAKESEDNLPLFAEYLSNGRNQDIESLPGIGYRKGGRIHANDPKPINYKDLLTPNFTGFPLDKYLSPVLPIQASRGCHWCKCKFCIHSGTYNKYFKRKAENLIKDMDELNNKYGTRLFHFTDDAIQPNLGNEISDQLIKLNRDYLWLTYARFEPKFKKETLAKWYHAGARIIEWGLESGSQKVLDLMDKGITISNAERILKDAASVGILNKCFMFHDYPGESVEDLKMSIDFIEKNIKDGTVRFFLPIRNRFELLKGSLIYDEVERKTSSHFVKVWLPSGDFSIRATYISPDDYRIKENILTPFLKEMNVFARENRLFSTNDDNITLDLICADIQNQGHNLFFNNKRPSNNPKSAEKKGR